MPPELSDVRALYRRLLAAKQIAFPIARERLKAPSAHGVYLIRSPRGTVLHVGRTVRGKHGLRQRLTNHIHGASSFTKQHLQGKGAKLRGTHTFSFVQVSDARLRALLEAYAVGNLCPKHIGLGENAAA